MHFTFSRSHFLIIAGLTLLTPLPLRLLFPYWIRLKIEWNWRNQPQLDITVPLFHVPNLLSVQQLLKNLVTNYLGTNIALIKPVSAFLKKLPRKVPKSYQDFLRCWRIPYQPRLCDHPIGYLTMDRIFPTNPLELYNSTTQKSPPNRP